MRPVRAFMIITRMFIYRRKTNSARTLHPVAANARCFLALVFGVFSLGASGSAFACPNLQPFYQLEFESQTSSASPELESQLAAMMGECLESSEYFALFGAVQMKVGKLAESLESLERALLLNPNNGAAQIDYAQALYQRGQLFSALDLNAQIIDRADTPDDIRSALTQRGSLWRQQTRQHGFQADLLAGYDDNLNGAPDPNQITLTLSGEPVLLPLGDEFRPKSGPYLNARLAGRFLQMTSDHRHNAMAEVRGRVSEDATSDLLQFDTRYAYERPTRDHTWRYTAGLAHLLFGGSSLYTASTIGAQYQLAERNNCSRQIGLALQHQLYHQQSALDAIEGKLAAGQSCTVSLGGWASRLGVEISLIANVGQGDSRPGGDRQGWQANFDWQFPIYRGIFTSQLNYTNTRDDTGYSALLENGANRTLDRVYLLLQYRQPISPNSSFLLNFYHQHQSSNIPLFDSLNTTFEAGVSFTF